MSKALEKEYLEDLDHYDEGMGIHSTSYEKCKERLIKLARIDNAEPSEALECLEKLKGMEISSMPFSDEYGTQEVDLNDIRKVGSQLNTDFREYTTTIKQALLKAQELEKENAELRQKVPEPKHYLKWEDLEFTAKEQTINVLLNGEKYFVKYRLGYLFGYYETVEITTKGCVLCTLGNLMIHFFNDLHLERVE